MTARPRQFDEGTCPFSTKPKWPALAAVATPAIMTFKMIFEATDRAVTYEDKAKHFRVTGLSGNLPDAAQIEVPTANSHGSSEPIGSVAQRISP